MFYLISTSHIIKYKFKKFKPNNHYVTINLKDSLHYTDTNWLQNGILVFLALKK